jgi:hypothetical protein
MAQAALSSTALSNVQNYLRQRRATGAQVTPQNERAAWSGYFDALEANRFNETALELQRNRQDLIEKQMKNEEDAAKYSGIGQLASTVGGAGLLLKGTDIGSKIGLGTTGAAPTATTGAATAAGAGPVTAALTPASAGASEAALAGGMAPSAALSVGPEAGILSAAAPYLGPAGAGFAAGTFLPGLLGQKKGVGELAVGAASGAAAGAAVGSIVPGPGTAVGAVIGAIAGGIGSKVK